MEKKYVLKLRKGSRMKGIYPRYVSSAEIVGDDIVIHTSAEPVYISYELAHCAGQVFSVATNQWKIFCYSIEEVIIADTELPEQEVPGNE